MNRNVKFVILFFILTAVCVAKVKYISQIQSLKKTIIQTEKEISSLQNERCELLMAQAEAKRYLQPGSIESLVEVQTTIAKNIEPAVKEEKNIFYAWFFNEKSIRTR